MVTKTLARIALPVVALASLAGVTACEPVPATPTAPAPTISPRRTQAVRAAKTQLGVPYVYGAASPGRGMDCSGLTSWAWRQAGLVLPRTAAAQWGATKRIARSQLLPGDLVFYAPYGRVSHVAMYIGNGQIIQARKVGVPVQIVSVDWWATARIGYGRIIL